MWPHVAKCVHRRCVLVPARPSPRMGGRWVSLASRRGQDKHCLYRGATNPLHAIRTHFGSSHLGSGAALAQDLAEPAPHAPTPQPWRSSASPNFRSPTASAAPSRRRSWRTPSAPATATATSGRPSSSGCAASRPRRTRTWRSRRGRWRRTSGSRRRSRPSASSAQNWSATGPTWSWPSACSRRWSEALELCLCQLRPAPRCNVI